MSGSAAATQPALEEYTAEERALLDQMQRDDADQGILEQASVPPDRPVPPARPTPPPLTPPEPVEPGTEAAPPQQQDGDPSAALRNERAQRRLVEKRLQEAERKAAADQARVEERLRLLSEAAQAHIQQNQPPPPPPEPIPDFNIDPAGFIQHGFRQMQRDNEALRAEVAELRTGSQRTTQAQQEQAAAFELQQWGLAGEKEFAARTADYPQAIAHLQRARETMVRAMGFTQPQQIQAAIGNDVRNLALIARQQNMNFGELLYNLAAAHGYQPGAAANGGVQPPAAQQEQLTPAERLVRGADMANTLGATSAAPRGDLAADRLAAMGDDEFEQMYAKLQKQGGAALRQLFGA